MSRLYFEAHLRYLHGRKRKKEIVRRKFRYQHQRNKDWLDWLDLPFMGRRYR